MPRPSGRAFTRPAARLFVVLIVMAVAIGPVSAAPGGPGVAGSGGHARPAGPAPIEDGLLALLDSGEIGRFIVEFTREADLAGAEDIEGFAARGRTVVNALRQAAKVQTEALRIVRGTRGARAQSFWLRNAMLVTGPASLAERLSRLEHVATVRAERVFPLVKPVSQVPVVLAEGSEPEWGVAKIGADGVWESGILGSGIVIANIDTGVDYTHPALVNQYRGSLGGGAFDHDYHWWDPTGICGAEPCDNAGHGTHTMGTMVGGDGPGPFTPDVGVAPGARWIAAKGCEDLFCSEGALLSSGQFILAPTDATGANPDPARRPDIVNNSWGAGPGDPFYEDVVSAWRAAGILPVFSAGNAGPSCGTGGSPGDFLTSFSAGATDDSDLIADFSSRGPSPFGKVNPDVSAPGVDVVSTLPGGGYGAFSGTSMAAPHVAGTLALVMSAEPGLIGQFDAATVALRDTAVDILDDQCGGADDGDPNNVYGDGRIDAAAAVSLVATGGTLAGTVTDADGGAPIAGAQISADNGLRTFVATADESGDFELFLAAGSYAVTATAFGYGASTAPGVEIVTDTTTEQDFSLTALPRYSVSGVVSAISDGAPISGAGVKAIGTPVAPALSDATGAYALELPLGSYTLRTSSGGCTDFAFADIELLADLEQDFELARKLDAFGHGCAPIEFTWDDAQTQTALYGDDFAGRLRLPFDFPFYGETYSQVFISDNGYLNFLAPDQFNPSPVMLPSDGPPNAAIYGLWQDLRVGAGGAIEYATVGTEPNRAFVIEYADVNGGGEHSFAMRLWENGDIDLVYDDAGSGDGAGIGIENADGSDALSFGHLAEVITPDSAWRITEVPTGLVGGTVTDANDTLPITGADVTAVGSGRTVRTGDDGTYALRLLPGTYDLVISAPGYTTFEQEITIEVDGEVVVDAALGAPIGSVAPDELTDTVALGEETTATVTISNTGSGALEWTARERPTSFEPPVLPVIDGTYLRTPSWSRADFPAGLPMAGTNTIPDELLGEIIADPPDDGGGGVDISTVRAGADTAEMTMEIDFSEGAADAYGFAFLDVDQDPSTGVPPDALFGLPTQEIGMEYFVDLFAVHEPEPTAFIVDAFTFELVAAVPARVDDDSIGFDVPLEAIGGDDGSLHTAVVMGNTSAPTDWAPDAGFGLVEPFTDAPWMSASPDAGTVGAGDTTDVEVTLGGADVQAGEYSGRMVFVSNDPKSAPMVVTVRLTVTLPESFGSVSGSVTDAHTGESLPGTSVTVEAELDGDPFPVSATTDADGAYSVFAPEGAWPIIATLDGHLPAGGEVLVTRGRDTPAQDFALHRIQPHASLDGGPLEFVLPEGSTDEATLVIGNPEGHEVLEWETGEVDMGAGASLAPGRSARALPAGADPNARTTRNLGFRAAPDSRSVNVPGDVIGAFFAEGADVPWGVGYTGSVWISDAFEGGDACGFVAACTTHEYATDGTPGTVLDGPWAEAFIGDMAYDSNRGWLWQVHVGGTNQLVAIDPADGSIQAELTGSPWSDISQRGVAYDAASDTFYVGGWNEGVVYHVAGLSWATPGEELGSCAPADPAISGLAWNPAFSLLWMATNSEADAIYLLDPATCDTLQAIGHPEPGFNGAGLEIDAVGNLWTVAQTGTAYLIESGLPNFSDAPWLSVEPTSGSVAPDETAEIDVSVDATGLEPGVYRAQVIVLTDDPDNAAMAVPVKLVVPAYRLGINAGGRAYRTIDDIRYASDRTWRGGPYGYEGRSTTRVTRNGIAETGDDPMYRDIRQGMTFYRFAVPVEGTYLVDLHFAEIVARRVDQRVFTVFIEDQPVLVNLDVFEEAGRNTAHDRSFVVEVFDGQLDIEFSGQRGDAPMVSAILVTHRPDFGPE